MFYDRPLTAHSCPSMMILKRLLSSVMQIILRPKSPVMAQNAHLLWWHRLASIAVYLSIKVIDKTSFLAKMTIKIEKAATSPNLIKAENRKIINFIVVSIFIV